jgi:SAM-dependent methyltransferase
MLDRARQLAPPDMPIDFARADATVYQFVSGSFDLLVSRFGVMFFAEPALSFANMRRALRPSGRLTFACWRAPRNNPWLMAPLQAVYKHVPKLPQLGPDDPGPFSFASEQRVHGILSAAGFSGIAMEPCNLSLDTSVGRGLDAAVETALEIGPASRALDGQPPDVVAAARNSIREALFHVPHAHRHQPRMKRAPAGEDIGDFPFDSRGANQRTGLCNLQHTTFFESGLAKAGVFRPGEARSRRKNRLCWRG